MATKTVIEESDDVTASQLKDLFRQIGEKSITGKHVQAFLEHRNPFEISETKVKPIKYLIDCDTSPFIPNGWSVEWHDKGGMIEFNASNVDLYLSKNQGRGIVGTELHKELKKDKKVLNANVLDYLLAHPELIPEEWKGKAVFFWGTIYGNSNGYLCVRYLDWNGDAWRWRGRWLGDGFGASFPAAVSVC